MDQTINFRVQHWTLDMEKQVGDRINTVMCDPQLLSVFQKFGGEVFRRSSVYHGLRRFLEENDIHGKTCFEVGTWNALTSVVLSNFFDRVVTVDIAHNSVKHDIIQHLGIKNIECIDIDSNADKEPIVNSLKFDFAYLDGNHAEDTESDWELTRKCGRVLFHECWPFQSPVWGLVHSLRPNQVVRGGFGLAMWDGHRPKVAPAAPKEDRDA
jgi:hypothetical protein